MSLNQFPNNRACSVQEFHNYINIFLQIYSGTNLASEVPLLDTPSALVSLYTDNNNPHIPGIKDKH